MAIAHKERFMRNIQDEMLIGFQTAFLSMLKQRQKLPPRSKWPVTVRIVMDALRDTGMINIVEGQASLTAEGHQFADKLTETQKRASNNLKSVPEEQIMEDMRTFLDIGLRELRKEFPVPAPVLMGENLLSKDVSQKLDEMVAKLPKWVSKDGRQKLEESVAKLQSKRKWEPPTATDDLF